MSTFRDLDEFLTDEPIRLPIRGTTYEFPGAVSGHVGLMLRRMAAEAQRIADAGETANGADLAREVLTDDQELDLRGEILGDVEQQMADDGLTTAHITHVFRTLIVWHTAGEEAALAAWETMGKAPTPNRAARRAGASTTRSRTSGSGTTTRKPARAASRGRGSSSSGR